MKCSVFIATSLDGFIARRDGSLDWLPGADPDSQSSTTEDHGYQAFMDSVDALVMGRKTFETVQSFGFWPYGEKRVVVLSQKELAIPDELQATVESRNATPEELVSELAATGVEHIYVDGGNTIQRFIDAGLVQQVIISVVPVLIGEGVPLFGPLAEDVTLRHVETQTFSSGIVQSRYEI